MKNPWSNDKIIEDNRPAIELREQIIIDWKPHIEIIPAKVKYVCIDEYKKAEISRNEMITNDFAVAYADYVQKNRNPQPRFIQIIQNEKDLIGYYNRYNSFGIYSNFLIEKNKVFLNELEENFLKYGKTTTVANKPFTVGILPGCRINKYPLYRNIECLYFESVESAYRSVYYIEYLIGKNYLLELDSFIFGYINYYNQLRYDEYQDLNDARKFKERLLPTFDKIQKQYSALKQDINDKLHLNQLDLAAEKEIIMGFVKIIKGLVVFLENERSFTFFKTTAEKRIEAIETMLAQYYKRQETCHKTDVMPNGDSPKIEKNLQF